MHPNVRLDNAERRCISPFGLERTASSPLNATDRPRYRHWTWGSGPCAWSPILLSASLARDFLKRSSQNASIQEINGAHVVRIAGICLEFINLAVPAAEMLASRMLRDGTKD